MKRQNDDLTNLEGAILALVAREGPMTGYALVRTFSNSQSEFWSGSAGAIYPLLRRLKSRELIAGASARIGRRAAISYRVTAAGRREMERWLLDADRAADMGFDPLRTRMIFLDLAAPAQRSKFVDAVARKTDALRVGEAWDDDSPHLQRVNRSWLKFRLAWLRALSR